MNTAPVLASGEIAMVSATLDLKECASKQKSNDPNQPQLLSSTIKLAHSYRCVGGSLQDTYKSTVDDLLITAINACRGKQLERIISSIAEIKLKSGEGENTAIVTARNFFEIADINQKLASLRYIRRKDLPLKTNVGLV